MAKVVFRPSGKTIECEIGDNLLEVARRADVYIEAPCNGSKSCGKCKVKLLTGEVNQEVSSHLSDEDREKWIYLSMLHNNNIRYRSSYKLFFRYGYERNES